MKVSWTQSCARSISPGHAIDQPEDAVHVRFVQRPLGTWIARQDLPDEFSLVHKLRQVKVLGCERVWDTRGWERVA